MSDIDRSIIQVNGIGWHRVTRVTGASLRVEGVGVVCLLGLVGSPTGDLEWFREIEGVEVGLSAIREGGLPGKEWSHALVYVKKQDLQRFCPYRLPDTEIVLLERELIRNGDARLNERDFEGLPELLDDLRRLQEERK